MDIAVAQGALGEHVGERHGGGGGGGDIRVDLAAVAAHHLEHLGHVIRGGDPISARREGDAAVAPPRLEGHGPRLEAAVFVDLLDLEGIVPAAVLIVLRLGDGQPTIAHDGEIELFPRLGGTEGIAGDLHGEARRLTLVHLLHQEVAPLLQALDLPGLTRLQGQSVERSFVIFALPDLIGVGDLLRPSLGGVDLRRSDLDPAAIVHSTAIVYICILLCAGGLRPCVLVPSQQTISTLIGRCFTYAKSRSLLFGPPKKWFEGIIIIPLLITAIKTFAFCAPILLDPICKILYIIQISLRKHLPFTIVHRTISELSNIIALYLSTNIICFYCFAW